MSIQVAYDVYIVRDNFLLRKVEISLSTATSTRIITLSPNLKPTLARGKEQKTVLSKKPSNAGTLSCTVFILTLNKLSFLIDLTTCHIAGL